MYGQSGQMPVGTKSATTELIAGVIVTLLCCLPAGIVAIIYAAGANSAYGMGDVATGDAKKATASKWILAAVILSVTVTALFIILSLVAGASSTPSTYSNL